MKLRNKLIVLHASVMALLLLIVVGLLVNFFRRSVPLMEAGALTATRSCLASMLRDVDIAVASRDRQLLREIIKRCDHPGRQKHDTRFIAITDAAGRVLVARGSVPRGLRADPAIKHQQVRPVEAGFRGQAPVKVEGKRLGTVWAELSTTRIHQWKSSYLLLSAVALALALVSGVASVLFVLHLIRPLRDMIDHVHRVAGGDLDGQLTTGARDELGQLAADLNAMTVKVRDSRDLVADVSRHAGQAEVATSVLHNVGNVLNSINVSTEMLHHRLRHSKVDSLSRMAALIEAAEGATGFAGTEKGRELPRFVCAIARRLASEREAILGEVAALRENLEHVKTVVTAQQQYSKAIGLRERTNLGEIIDTAIQITLKGDQGSRIEVSRELDGVPALVLDRHRLLQVLINLLRNAKHALQESRGDSKQLVVRVVARDRGRVAIEIRDNGVGIPEENRTRIFQHGFTTRPDGHGFGLHSSSIAVQEMGGRLSCESAGDGAGATFIVELPLAGEQLLVDKEEARWTTTRGTA